MYKSSLVQLVLAQSAEERRQLKDFLVSPYHNHRDDIVRLYDFIDRNIDDNWLKLDRENAFAAVYPEERFDGKKLRYVMSFLLKTIEEFLIHREATRDPLISQLFLLRAYRRRKLTKFFHKTLRRARDYHRRSFRDADYYATAYEIEWENYLFTAGQRRNAPSQLPVLNDVLDEMYLVRRLRQSCLLQAHQAVFRESDDPRLLNLLMDFLAGHPLLDEPLLGAYYHYLQAVRHPDDVTYYRLFKAVIRNAGTDLPVEERRTLVLLAINYGIQRFNLGEELFLREVFEWYHKGLEEGLILENGRLSRFAFKNIVGIGLRLNEFEWTKQFIDEFQHTLSSRYRDNYVHFCLSKLRYNQGLYQEAMKRLLQVDYDDLYLNLDAKVMLMKMYYEMGEWQALDSLLTSFRRFIQRKKLMGYHRQSYLRIVRYFRKLLDLNPYDKEARMALRNEIGQAPALVEREWLLEQVAE